MKKVKFRWAVTFLCVGLLTIAACQKEKPKTQKDGMEKTAMAQAQADLKPTQGNKVTGVVTFTAQSGGILIKADLEGLTPGKHGFHIHEKGDCSAPDGSSAGGHFNPDNSPHGAPTNPAGRRHVGDLGNVAAGADGKAHYERVDQIIALEGPNSIIGRGVIVHAQADDLTSQPTGNAGSRLACGVIRLNK